MVKKIISGGQSGADQGGLVAGHMLGLETGGWIPKGFLTENGPAPELGVVYHLQEHKSSKYPPRTHANARDSDGTVWFGHVLSRGYLCTLGGCQKYNKPFRVILSSQDLRKFIKQFNIETLNVAGNCESKSPGICTSTTILIYEALR